MNLKLIRYIYAIFFLCAYSIQAAAFQAWSEKVFQNVEQEYGKKAEKRMRYFHQLILKNQNKTNFEKLKIVNDSLNQLPWIADKAHWKSADYWATPLETIATFGGDCEDMAIVKWIMLRHLGIPKERLRLAYVKIKKTGKSHMVLLYLDKINVPLTQANAYVLDNNISEIKKGRDRTDLLAIYAAGAMGELTLISDENNQRSVKSAYKGRKMKKIEDLKKRILQNRAKYQKLNDGRPLLPD